MPPAVRAKKKPRRKPAHKPAAKPVQRTCRVVTRKVRGKQRKVRVCKPVPKKRPVATPGRGHTPLKPAFPPATPLGPPPGPSPDPPADPQPGAGPPPIPFGRREAERLLWRAGFGPRPGDVDRLAAMGLDAAVAELVRPLGSATLTGPEPRDDDGNALQPADLWGHDHCWWLDRMVRSDQPLVERMTLVWHDWFATSHDKVQANLMLDQNALLRRSALGSFADLLRDVTVDPAMLVFLDGVDNSKRSNNENYAREVMELFTLGANRGAYGEADIRQAAKALTGWRADWSAELGMHAFRYDPARHDTAAKTIFGQTGDFGWQDVVRLCVEHPLHPSFLVTKLWSYFVGEPLDEATQALLQQRYVDSGRQVAPVVEAILKHPRLYQGPAMVKPPVVFCAGLLRALGRGIDTTAWTWILEGAGQVLFRPPNVSGWDDARWLDTSTWKGRWDVAAEALSGSRVDPWATPNTYSDVEDGATALEAAHAHVGRPALSAETAAQLRSFADTSLPAAMAGWQKRPYRAMRQNALRLLIATSADGQTC